MKLDDLSDRTQEREGKGSQLDSFTTEKEGRSDAARNETRTHLVVLDRQVVPLLTLLVSNLHEESRRQSLSDVEVVALVLERCRNEVEIVLLHRSLELGSNVVGLLKSSLGEEVVVGPVLVVLVCEARRRESARSQRRREAMEKKGRTGLVGVVNVEEGEVISFGVNELSLGLIGFLSSVDGSEEHVGDCRKRERAYESATTTTRKRRRVEGRRGRLTRKHGSQTQKLVTTAHLGGDDEHLGQL